MKQNYHDLIQYMKELKAFFRKEYGTIFKLGNLYQGNPEYTYFSLTPEKLKKQKLKFVIILNHKTPSFSICLSGQNKSIRKKYWEIFTENDWNKYHLAKSINDSLSIIDHTIVENPNFQNKTALTKDIETETFKFIQTLSEYLSK